MSAANEWFKWLGEVDRLAVVGVRLDGPGAAADLLGFVVEPVARLGIELVLGSDQTLEELDRDAFFEADFGYAYSLERLLWCLRGGQPEMSATRMLAEMDFVPDATQKQAVLADQGVVQIIAPAGSGKTAVLVERIRELLRRGAPPERIVAVTFNKAAREELEARLALADAQRVQARTFHSLGFSVLAREKALPRNPKPWSPSQGEWRRLAAIAKNQVGQDAVWFDPPDAQSALSNIKLGLLMRAAQYSETITEQSDPRERTLAALYTAYEALQHERERIDFDDQILGAVLALRDKPEVREHWQREFQYVLVDEYQDIEPAQELLVRTIAAPQDQLFCVGDEDQTLYAFRRASVERIICLDDLYPGLQRVALEMNYRCPPEVVKASRILIAHNKVRFKKEIYPARQDTTGDAIVLHELSRLDSGVAAAQTLKGHQRGEIVVLARTTDALRPVALSCADFGVPIDGPEKLFKPTGARLALEDHLRLALAPTEADEGLIQRVCQTPARGLSPQGRPRVAGSLRAGVPFETAFAGVDPPNRAQGKLWAPGDLFAALAECGDAADAIALLRVAGGFDEWFEDADRMGGLDEFECEVLEHAERDAAGMSPHAYLTELERQAEKLEQIRDSKHGIQLSTIHKAKGQQWPHVILIACDEGTLPHKRSVGATDEEIKRGEGTEAERRLAYVAFTRTQQKLEIHHEKDRPSRFLTEAALIAPPIEEARAARTPPPPPGLPEHPQDAPAQAGTSLREILKRLVSGD